MSQPGGDGVSARGACSVQLWLATGTADEGPGEHGAAHFTEHMVFRPWGEGGFDLASGIEALGGEVNAYTSHDETVYYASVQAAAVHDAIEILARAVFEPSFDTVAFERERDVVIEEISQYADDPGSIVSDKSAQQVFASHDYGRPILGTAQTLGSMTAADLAAFHRRTYVGRRLCLVVTGAVRRAEVHRWAKAQLGRVRSGRARPAKPRSPDLQSSTVEVLPVPGTDAELRLAWSGPALEHEDAVALDLLSVILGQGESARLSVRLRRELGVAQEAHAGFVPGVRAGTFAMACTSAPEHTDAAASALIDIRRELAERPPTASEIDVARALLESSLIYRKETASGQAHALGYYLCATPRRKGQPRDLERHYFEVLARLDARGLARAAQKHLSLEHAHMTVGLPSAGGRRANQAKRCRELSKALRKRLRPQVATGSRLHPSRRWKKRGGIWETRIDDGCRIVVRPDASLPLAAACIAWAGGQSTEAPKDAGLGQLAARTVARGDDFRTALGTARWLDERAASLEGYFGRGTAGLSLESTTPVFDELMQMALAMGARPHFEGLDVERERDATLDAIAADAEDPANASVQLALQSLYSKSHPYARPLRGSAAVIRKAGPAALSRYWARHDLRRAVVAVAGEVDPERVRAAVAAAQRTWPRAKSLPVLATAPKGLTRRLQRRSSRPDLAQSHLALGFRGVADGHEDAAALEVLVELLGSQSGRLFVRLRDELGLVYGVGVGMTCARNAGHILVHAAASADHFDTAVTETLDCISRLAAEGPSVDECRRARSTLVGHLERTLQRRSSMAAAMALHASRSGDASEAWAWPRAIARVRHADVVRVARKYLGAPCVVARVRGSDPR